MITIASTIPRNCGCLQIFSCILWIPGVQFIIPSGSIPSRSVQELMSISHSRRTIPAKECGPQSTKCGTHHPSCLRSGPEFKRARSSLYSYVSVNILLFCSIDFRDNKMGGMTVRSSCGKASSAPMSKMLGLLFLLLLSTFGSAIPYPETAIALADEDSHWVPTWTSMQQEVEQSNLPPSPFVR
jgi:hypothetical protein